MNPLPNAAPPRLASLRRGLLLAFAPLGALVLVASLVALVQVRRVHVDVLRIFEENREVALVRSLARELEGIADWLGRDGIEAPAVGPLVAADVAQHLERARQTLGAFDATANDPSRDAHQAHENRLHTDIASALDQLHAALASGPPSSRLLPVVHRAQRAAAVLATEVEGENRNVGLDLDQRTDDMGRLVLLLGGSCVLTLALLLLWFVRRVLRPLAELRQGAQHLGQGRLDTRLPVRVQNELGALAATFNTMADRLRDSQQDLERRVEQRSREVLRTTRLAELGTLAAGVAHEINNPLASIAACAEGLLRDAATLPDATREYLEIVHKEAMRARDITQRMLSFARSEPDGRRTAVSLADEIREVAAMFAHQAQRARLTVDLRLAPDLGTVSGNAGELRQVLFNLLRNALDASPAGATVTVQATRQTDRIAVQVADQGPGVPPQLRDRVFEPFFTTKAPGKGTGLGLAIAHRIVTAHGGRLEVVDAAGPGAVFRMELPAEG